MELEHSSEFKGKDKDVNWWEEEDNDHTEHHKGGAGGYIKSIIYGGLDGCVSVFVSVAAIFGGTGGGSQVTGVATALIVGLAKLVAGSLSMAIGDFLSTDAEVDLINREMDREKWEVENYLEGEIDEMVDLYAKKGVPEENARKIMRIFSKYPNAFVDIMMTEELGMNPEDAKESPLKHGGINFISFIFFGLIPLIAFIVVIGIRSGVKFDPAIAFYVTIGVTAVTLIFMGLMKGFLTGTPLIKSAIITLVLGGCTAIIGWGAAFILHEITGVNIGD